MARVLIRLKLTLLGHSLRGGQATFFELGALVALLVAGWMWLVALGAVGATDRAFDSLALAVAAWAIGWVFISLSAGGDPLRPESFRMVPVRVASLAAGLFAASFVGVLPAATAVGFAALVVAAGLVGGPAAALVAAPAMVLTMTVVILLARVVAGAGGQASGSRIGLELAGFAQGLLISLIWIWIPIAAIAAVPGSAAGVTAATATPALARALPTGWGVVATEAAAHHDWPVAVAALGGLGVIAIGLWLAWSRLLQRRLTGASAGGSSAGRQPASPRSVGLPSWAATPRSATVAKELRAWQRQPRRAVEIRSAIWTAVIVALLPAAFGSTVLWPFAGLALLLTAAVTASNLYGSDGSAIWLTVEAPGTERADVRGRQVAWLVVFGSLGALGTVVFTALAGATWAWPWVLAALPALAGASVGLIPWIGLLVPGPLPERRDADPLDPGDDPRTTGALVTQGVVMTFLPILLAGPALAIGFGADMAGIPGGRWWGGVAGVTSGLVYAWGFGALAIRRLSTRGPDLLERMRSRPAPRPTTPEAKAAARERAVPRATWIGVFVGSILLFPQALVPLLLLASDSSSRLWFVPLYLPSPLQVPAIVGSAAAGIVAYVIAWRLAADRRRRGR
jgi:ABC-2 type transport system permease protein